MLQDIIHMALLRITYLVYDTDKGPSSRITLLY